MLGDALVQEPEGMRQGLDREGLEAPSVPVGAERRCALAAAVQDQDRRAVVGRGMVYGR